MDEMVWQRFDEPILSASTTRQSWCKVCLYSPHVIRVDGKFRMWYVGNASATRMMDHSLGYAESDDGLEWTEHEGNPILTPADIPWGHNFQTPQVLFDAEEGTYKMWFVATTDVARDARGKNIELAQKLGYATSPDGIEWAIRPEPIFESGRRPCVIKNSPERYLMYMNSRPEPGLPFDTLYKNIYAFTSGNGVDWQRGESPIVQPSGSTTTCVYPYVVVTQQGYLMWHGAHVPGGKFEIFMATSSDGETWNAHHEQPAFSAADDRDRFDGRYVSTPCVLQEENRWLLYYSARDWSNDYVAGDGSKRSDAAGVYRHIGVAVSPV